MAKKQATKVSEDQDSEKPEKEAKRKLPVVSGTFDFRPSYVLGKDGPIAKDLSDYQVRQPQITLAENIQLAFQEKKNLICEAATGTGKSFACLLAAFETSIGTQSPVVISTHTIALQEQLCNKDVPFLLEKLGLNINVTLAKGRGNYVSIRRAELAIKDKVPDYSKLAQWLKTTKDGTTASMSFKPDSLTWNRSKSDTDQCLGDACKSFNECFYQQSRRKLAESHVIISNHNMVLLDLKLKASGFKGVLPEYKYLIFDEAHEVENVARKVFTFELNQKELPSIFYEMHNDKNTGFLDQMVVSAEMTLREMLIKTANPKEVKEEKPGAAAVKGAAEAIEELLKKNDEYFRKVAAYVGSSGMKRITEKEAIKSDIFLPLQVTINCLKSLGGYLIEKDQKLALEFAMKRCTEIGMGVDQIQTLPNIEGKDYPEIVAWGSSRTGGQNKTYTISCAPIFLKPTMKRLVYRQLDSVVFTSATLATGGVNPFRMLESSLGIEDPMRLRLPPVFDYSKQASIIVIEDVPEQSAPTYNQVLAEQIKKFVKATGGGAFVLFTSFKTMNEVYELTKVSFEMAGLNIFCQGKGLNNNQMISQFKSTMKGVLFGVNSFWAGIDVPGKALRNLIITKLPFPIPNDPVMEAQAEIYAKFKKNFFTERALPMTAIALKQGFGRLIRKSTDKGIVVILDSRVVKKSYGKTLLSALPSNCPIKLGKCDSKISNQG